MIRQDWLHAREKRYLRWADSAGFKTEIRIAPLGKKPA
jgi:protein subunit release factor B